MEQKIKRPKKFQSMESLWYESERLATFIGWPVKYISEKELAAEGFYYLRTKDHCACAFCRGIIGAWEEGDTPRGEHKRHFPHCPFVLGKVTPNVPLYQGLILAKINVEVNGENVANTKVKPEDVCGTGKSQNSSVSVKLPTEGEEISLKSLGFREYCGPKRKDHITQESRLRSFKHWPDEIKQKPESMAEAGFFYCGLSDHVRCFHCGNGLRNWEDGDEPWIEHARWYPECHFVLLQKGVDFIDKVRREKPPYVPSPAVKEAANGASSSGGSSGLSDDDLEQLLELHIMKAVLKMGFAKNQVKTALMNRLKQTGLPFYSQEEAIEAILQVMEEEKKKVLQGCEEVTSQARKIVTMEGTLSLVAPTVNSERSSEGGNDTVTTAEDAGHVDTHFSEVSILPASAEGEDVVEETMNSSSQHIPNSTLRISDHRLPILNLERASPPLRSSTPTSQITNIPQPMELEAPNDNTESQPGQGESRRIEVSVTVDWIAEPSVQETARTQPLLNEADVVIEKAAKLLAPTPSTQASCSTTSQSLTESTSQDSGIDKEDMDSNSSSSEEEANKEKQVSATVVDAENLAMELEKIKETRMCRVCMDKDMDVVFLPCTHMVACSSCAVALSNCPICRRDIQYAFKPIMS